MKSSRDKNKPKKPDRTLTYMDKYIHVKHFGKPGEGHLHEVSIVEKVKQYKASKAAMNQKKEFFAKKEKSIVTAQREVSMHETNRALYNRNPKTKLVVDRNIHANADKTSHVLSESIPGFRSLYDIILKDGYKNVIDKINAGEYKGLGKIMVLALLTGESDLHYGNIGLNDKNEFCKIDGDWTCGRLRYKEGTFSDKKQRVFHANYNVLRELPLLDTDHFFPYNWFDQVEEGVNNLKPGFLGKIKRETLRVEIYEQLLRCILMPEEYYRNIIKSQTLDESEASTTALEIMHSRNLLMSSALQDERFLEFVQTDEAINISNEFAEELKTYKMAGKVSLDNEDILQDKITGRLATLRATIDPKHKINTFKLLMELVEIDVNAVNKHGETPLLLAASSGDFELFATLIEKGADVNAVTLSGETVLTLAAKNGHHESIEYMLIDHPELKTQFNAALIAAIDSDKDETVKFLLDNGANVNAQDSDGDPMIVRAVIMGAYKSLLTLLTPAACDVNAMDINGTTALLIAVINNDVDSADALLTFHADTNIANNSGETPLLFAVHNGNREIINMILYHDTNSINMQDDMGCTALISAIKRGYHEIALQLANTPGININIANNLGETATSLALKNGDIELLTSLFKQKSLDEIMKINTRSGGKYKDTLLLAAACKGDFELANELLKTGADINSKSKDNESVITLAAAHGHTDMLEYTLESFPEKMDQIQSALLLAAKYNHSDTVALLVDRYDADINHPNAKGETPLMVAAIHESHDVMNMFIKTGDCNLNARDRDGNTALLSAIILGNTASTRILLEAGADPNQANNQHDTPLMFAAHFNYDEIAELLRERDIRKSINLQDSHGNTALMNAMMAGNHDIAMHLIGMSHIDVNIANKNGDTPLKLALSSNNTELEEFLIANGATLLAPVAHADKKPSISTLNSSGTLFHKSLASNENSGRTAKDDVDKKVNTVNGKSDNTLKDNTLHLNSQTKK